MSLSLGSSARCVGHFVEKALMAKQPMVAAPVAEEGERGKEDAGMGKEAKEAWKEEWKKRKQDMLYVLYCVYWILYIVLYCVY